MRVVDVMCQRPITTDAHDSMQEAAQRMRVHVVSVLPVLDQGELVGMVTVADLVLRGVASGHRPRDTPVREVMSHHPLTCHAEDSVESAAARMASARVRHLIVVSGKGQIQGVLSVDDLLASAETRTLAVDILSQAAILRGELDGLVSDPSA